MGRRSVVLAAGVGLAAAWLPARPAVAQGEKRGDHGDGDQDDRDHGKGGDHGRDHDDRDHDKGDHERDHGDRDQDKGDHGRDHRDDHGPGAAQVRSVLPRSGAAGTQVTIQGRFPAGTTVLFGGVAVPLVRTDRRSLTFAVPRGPGGPRAIVVRAGGADVPAGEFRVDGPPRAEPPPPPMPSGRREARWDRNGWVMLGEQTVRGKRDRDEINVGRREGRFTRLMVVVEDSDLEMHSMDVVFAGGQRFSPPLRHYFREDDRTRAIDLPGESRSIARIEFHYGNLPGGGAARVEVWGREGGGPDPGHGRPPPPPPPMDRDHFGHGPPLVTDFWPRQGPAGTEVTIQGRRFTPDLVIDFGGQVIRPSRSDDSLLTFAVPRVRGAALIMLRRPGRRDVPVGSFAVSGRDANRERERWREARRIAAERWWMERQRKLAGSEAAREEALRAEEDRLARERERRRIARRAALRARWDRQLLMREDVRGELALHAERSARLDRMLRLAESGEYGRLVVRIRLLVDYEDARHQQRMDDLKLAYARR
jgi:hypothetical protein